MERPKWWLLYTSLPLMAFLLWLDIHLNLSVVGHEIFEISIVLVTFGWMVFSVTANQPAIENEQNRNLDFEVSLGASDHLLQKAKLKEDFFREGVISDFQVIETWTLSRDPCREADPQPAGIWEEE